MAKQLRVGVVGATGVVGKEMLATLAARQFPATEIRAVASARSAGKKIAYGADELEVRPLSREALAELDVALFSAGGSTSREWSPVAAELGALVIDNSSAWRMDPEVPLCVPEINLDAARSPKKGIIANPNCSTIQMVVALNPLHREARIRRVVVATYQAISGSGLRATEDFQQQQRALVAGDPVPEGSLQGQLAGNLLMHWKRDEASGYQEEELKMVNETRKILGDSSIQVSPTAVRVPVVTGHSEAVAVEFHSPLSAQRARELLEQAPGVKVVDDFAKGVYPTPVQVAGRDPVMVGRIRQDIGNPDGIQMWIVGDNLRKGAALNAVQIAEGLLL